MHAKNKLSLVVVMTLGLMSTACVKRSVNDPGIMDVQTGESSASKEEDDFALDESAPVTDEIKAAEEVAQETTPVADASQTSSEPWVDKTADKVALTPDAGNGPEIKLTGAVKDYVVKEGETLMLVAHNIYGDHRKWRDIRDLNMATLGKKPKALSGGTILKYYEPVEAFVQSTNGDPYLIQKLDTLGTISTKVYQTPKKWKSIWKNNTYIKNPNLIFAGFTLYYVKDEKLAKRM